MQKQVSKAKILCMAAVVAAFAALGFVPAASAHSGEYSRFDFCPSTTAGVFKCTQAITKGGKVVMGKKTVPIVNPVTVQGGVGVPNPATGISSFFAATNGETVSKTPQPVPGGLSGLVNCKEISDFFLRKACEAVFENGLTGVNATVELARPANEMLLSEFGLAFEFGTALKMPVKIHLENPFLGSTCYVGSSTAPVIWNLTTGETAPPPPNTAIHGFSGESEFLEGGSIFVLNGTELVDNSWAAPKASGCGGFPAELLLNPIINASVGLPAAAGTNTTLLQKTRVSVALASAVNSH
jgi:hypothetical protein